MKKSLSVIVLFALLVWAGALPGAEDQEPTTTISGKINLTIVGVTYDTLTLVNCFNVDLVNCTIKNLVLVHCWNVDITNSAFVGEGVAVVADTSLAVATSGCTFAETYSQRLMSIHSALITIE